VSPGAKARPAGAFIVGPRDRPIRGTWQAPGDKSISHRAAIVAAMANGRSVVEDFSPGLDCMATLDVLAALGAEVSVADGRLRIRGRGTGRLAEPSGPLDCRRSGTTMRLLSGVLAAAPFRSVLTGDEQLLRRPMERVAQPLRLMGAEVHLAAGGRPPIGVTGGVLTGLPYRLPIPSAQVKSAVLLAGLSAMGTTTVMEPVPTRDHTERLLEWLELPVDRLVTDDGTRATTVRQGMPPPFHLRVPGDLSLAAFLVAGASLVPGSDLVIRGVGVNPTRMGFVDALMRMGAAIEVEPRHDRGPEPSGDIRVRHGPLHAISLGRADIPSLVDELPLLGVLATQAEGATVIDGASELRVKESDRISGLVQGLRALGADAEELPDGFVVRGPTRLIPAGCDARHDHRLAMTFAIAGLAATGPVRVHGIEAAADSFPGFVDVMGSLE
jgi:3-phosphoshikimate 1-carboxyvinyltransferase